MSDSVRSHRRQPTRLLRPWDFPGKSTGVGCHRLLLMGSKYPKYLMPTSIHFREGNPFQRRQSISEKPARLLCPWNFPGENTEVDCHFLLQGIILTQRLNSYLLCPLHWQVDSLVLCHQGSPTILYLFFIFIDINVEECSHWKRKKLLK